MSIKTKIRLSKLEMELVTDTNWILTKQEIIEKVYLLFGELHETYKRISKEEKKFLREFDLLRSGKISKGENYMGLPYIILDYPAIFQRRNVFAIRTMFWWGNFFSITLHISGENRMQTLSISNLLTHLQHTNLFVCINEDEWQHNFESTNYIPVNEIDREKHELICSRSFFKISKKIDLKNWDEVPGFLEKSYRELIEYINVSFPAGEKVL